MMNSSKLEKLFYTKEKNLRIQVFHVLLISIPISLFLAELFKRFAPIKNDASNNDFNIFIIYLAVGYISSLSLVFPIYFGIFSDYLGKYSYYIEHEIHGKMYVVKTISKNEFILFENHRLHLIHNFPMSLIIERAELRKYPIFIEINTSNFVEDLKFAWNKIKEKLSRS